MTSSLATGLGSAAEELLPRLVNFGLGQIPGFDAGGVSGPVPAAPAVFNLPTGVGLPPAPPPASRPTTNLPTVDPFGGSFSGGTPVADLFPATLASVEAQAGIDPSLTQRLRGLLSPSLSASDVAIADACGASPMFRTNMARVRCTPVNRFEVRNPSNGRIVHYARVIPTGFRIAGKRRSRRPR